MKRKEFRELISVEDARKIINNLQVFPEKESVPLENTYGKALAEDIVTEINVPPFPKANMDGYAVRAEDTYTSSETKPVKLKLLGNIPAGSDSKFIVSAGEAVEIATGAQIPEGANAVVMVEYTSEKNGIASIFRPVTVGENIMKEGSDILKGERVLRRGRKIGTREIGVLASIGKRDVPVLRLPVGIISTGDELVSPGENLTQGKVYDANSYTLYAGVQECGAFPMFYGIVKDDESVMGKALETAVSECALILTSGSTSSGAGDVMYRLIDEAGETLAHGINIKPGKPVVIGIIKGVPIIGLPGHPTSALMIFNEFVAPLLRKSLGAEAGVGKKEKGIMGTDLRSEDRQQLLPVGMVRGRVYPADRGSGAITSLSRADGFIEIPPKTEFIEAGTPLEVTLFGEVEKPDLLIAGGFCPGLDILEDLSGLRFRILYTGSSGGFSAIAVKTADIAGVNMPSKSKGQEGTLYNIPTIKNMVLSDVVLVKGYRREVGLLVNKDSTITGLEDLPGKRLINRNRGSGTRALLEMKIEELAGEKRISKKEFTDSIQGYSSGTKSEVAVCETVLSGKADAGVGLKNCAKKNKDLKFIKLAEEEYDFLIRKEVLDTPEVNKFLQTLGSAEFASKLPSGLQVYERTGEIILFE